MVDTDKIAKELRRAIDALQNERYELDEKIRVMEETLSKLGVKRGPGRPKGSKNKSGRGPGRPPGRPRKKPNWSADQRKKVSERMKKYWADRRKKKSKAKAS